MGPEPFAKRTVRGRHYLFGYFAASEAIDLEVFLMRVGLQPFLTALATAPGPVLELLGSTPASAGGTAEDKAAEVWKPDEARDQEANAFALRAAAEFTSKLNAAEIRQMMTTAFRYVNLIGEQSGNSAVSIEAFTGRPVDKWLVFLIALRFNFADFFPEKFLSLIDARLGKMG